MISKKILFVVFLILICFLLIAVGFFNYERIAALIYGEKWVYIEPIEDIKGVSVIDITGNDRIISVSNKEINTYSGLGDHIETFSSVSNNYLLDRNGDYSVVVANDTNTIYVFKNSNLVSQFTVSFEIKNVSINKNGTVAIIFMQNGYKSGVKVFSQAGNEQLTTYLATTDAIDCLITDDNRYLYIAMTDMSGIRVNSSLKIINISSLNKNSEEKVEEFEIGKDELVYDLQTFDNSTIYILTTSGIYTLSRQNVLTKIYSIDYSNTLYTSIDAKRPVVVCKDKEDNLLLKVLGNTHIVTNLDNIPQSIECLGNTICLNMGDCIEIYNSKCNLIYKIDLSNKVVDMLLYSNGKKLAIVYRDKIEIFDI